MAVGQNLVPLVNPKIAGKWMFIPLKMVLIGIDPYPHIIYILRAASCVSTNWTLERLLFILLSRAFFRRLSELTLSTEDGNVQVRTWWGGE